MNNLGLCTGTEVSFYKGKVDALIWFEPCLMMSMLTTRHNLSKLHEGEEILSSGFHLIHFGMTTLLSVLLKSIMLTLIPP